MPIAFISLFRGFSPFYSERSKRGWVIYLAVVTLLLLSFSAPIYTNKTLGRDLLHSTEQENAVREKVEAFTIEGELRRETGGNIKRLKDIKSYRGSRHAKRLPARGQRTKTNSRTVRGNVRKTMGSGRRKLEKK